LDVAVAAFLHQSRYTRSVGHLHGVKQLDDHQDQQKTIQ
jgi:hypothetical protein